MTEYIRREDAIKCIECQCVDGKMFGNDESEGTLIEAYSAIDDLMEIPPADVAPVRHGRWFPTAKWWQGGSAWKQCSECGILHLEKSNFYPHCGAKMDGDEP